MVFNSDLHFSSPFLLNISYFGWLKIVVEMGRFLRTLNILRKKDKQSARGPKGSVQIPKIRQHSNQTFEN